MLSHPPQAKDDKYTFTPSNLIGAAVREEPTGMPDDSYTLDGCMDDGLVIAAEEGDAFAVSATSAAYVAIVFSAAADATSTDNDERL
ncbi:hypothetical protein GCM10028811_03490 [Uliginosibacterium sediminicola]